MARRRCSFCRGTGEYYASLGRCEVCDGGGWVGVTEAVVKRKGQRKRERVARAVARKAVRQNRGGKRGRKPRGA